MKKDKRFVITFLVIIYAVLLLYPVNYVLINKGILVNSYSSFANPQKVEGNIINRVNTKLDNYKNYLDVMVTNYFPLYSEINYYTGKTLSFIDENEYKLFGQKAISLGQNSDNEYVVKNFEDGFFYLLSNKSDKELDERLAKEIDNFKKIASYDVPVLLYLPYRYDFTNNESIDFRNYDKYKTEFKEKLDKVVDILELDLNKEEYMNSFYKTDHHWNSYAVKQALKDIGKHFNVKVNDYEVKGVEGIKIYGSMAKSAGDTTYYDHLLYLDTPYKLRISNPEYKKLSVTPRKDLFYDYYVGYYDGLTEEVLSYDYGNGDENLLIIGDSFVWQMDYILAESFNKTYTVNTRYIENFNYGSFIKENNISKVLILMDAQSTLFDVYDYNLQERLGL